MARRTPLVAALCLGGLITSAALAQTAPRTVTLTSVADATLIEDPIGALANGSGINLFTGRIAESGGSTRRRALVRFDLQGIPPGAVIQSAALSLSLTRSRFAGELPVSLHRVTASWTEGPSASAQGLGEPSQTGDTTWIHRSKPALLWMTPGGEFLPTASATRVVGATGGAYQWQSTPALVSDVQLWVNTPATNFGWAAVGFEGGGTSAKAFATREATIVTTRPTLVVTYVLSVSEEEIPLPLWALALLAATLATVVGRSRRD